MLFYLSWSGWGIQAAAWAVIMLVVATALGLLMLWRETDIAYALVLVWAFIGIAISQADAALVAKTAWVTAALLVLGAILIPLLRRGAKVNG